MNSVFVKTYIQLRLQHGSAIKVLLIWQVADRWCVQETGFSNYLPVGEGLLQYLMLMKQKML
ncbi:MAG: hypothetical protein WKG06_12055 [Segetibacter sp.]